MSGDPKERNVMVGKAFDVVVSSEVVLCLERTSSGK